MITHQQSIRLQIMVEDVTQTAVNLNDARPGTIKRRPGSRITSRSWSGKTMRQMNKFAELINGMSAEERAAMKDDAETFLKNQAEFETCLFCGTNITDLVCDAPIGFEMAGYKDAVEKTPFTKAVIACRYLDRTSEMFTCDLPVCEACRTQGSAIFFCGGHEDGWYAEALGENKSASDPRGIFVPDLCPLHRSAPSLGTDHPSKRTPVITKEESQTWRAQTRMLIENGKLSKAKAYPEIKEEEKS